MRETAERPINVGLVAVSSEAIAAMEDFLAPPTISRQRRYELVKILHRAGDPGAPQRFDVELYEEGLARPNGAFTFHRKNPERTVEEILHAREELGLALARHFPPFRKPTVDRVIRSISKENAIFSVLTAVPDIVPSLIQFPWAVGEFASDTAFITMNQVRMAFLIAGASDRLVGYREQRAEIASIVAGAFGWRALARELVGKIPFGGGLIPKAAVAYAGTYTVGQGLERFYRIGYRLTREERRAVYEEALEHGKKFVASLLEGAKIREAGEESTAQPRN